MPVDRPPIICPGGMMTMAVHEAMRISETSWPAAHRDPAAMSALIRATREATGLECLSAPFCMTVEAEAMGCRVDLGDDDVLPHVLEEPVGGPDDFGALLPLDPEKTGRVRTTLDAIKILKGGAGDLPVIGAVVGPFSLAAMLMRAESLMRLLRRNPDAADAMLSITEGAVLDFARMQARAGADCVMIAEPTGTGEVLGNRHFARFVMPRLSRILLALSESGVPAMIHICGDLRPAYPAIREMSAGLPSPLVLSVDSMVAGHAMARELPGVTRVGNVDTHLLAGTDSAKVAEVSRRAAREFNIVSPACGLAPCTPVENLLALARTVRGEA